MSMIPVIHVVVRGVLEEEGEEEEGREEEYQLVTDSSQHLLPLRED